MGFHAARRVTATFSNVSYGRERFLLRRCDAAAGGGMLRAAGAGMLVLGADTVVRVGVDCVRAAAGASVEWCERAAERCRGAGWRWRCGESRVAVASRGVERVDGDAVRVTQLTETSRLVCRTKSIAEGDRRADLPTVIGSPISLPAASARPGG